MPELRLIQRHGGKELPVINIHNTPFVPRSGEMIDAGPGLFRVEEIAYVFKGSRSIILDYVVAYVREIKD